MKQKLMFLLILQSLYRTQFKTDLSIILRRGRVYDRGLPFWMVIDGQWTSLDKRRLQCLLGTIEGLQVFYGQ